MSTHVDPRSETKPKVNYFVLFSTAVSDWAGKPVTFALAVAGICIWAILGPFLNYSEGWQLVVNTATTIITFLMIFVLQNSQNRDGKALQAKLDELILTSKGAENKFIGIEKLDEEELRELKRLIDEKAGEDRRNGEEPNPDLRAAGGKLSALHEQKAAAE